MAGFMHNLMILPVILPLITGAVLLFISERHRFAKSIITLASTGLVVIIAAGLVSNALQLSQSAEVYNLGNWLAPFGIVFVLDKLSAIFVLMGALISCCAILYATAHWDKIGAHFYSFTQFFLVGINGAFLTGDIFNLFVFFEIMLTASYALLMHGGGLNRVKAGSHFVTINLIASFCFLIAVACIYGSVGTLNMADLAAKLGDLSGDQLLICQIGLGILGIAFLIKAGIWPLCFWVSSTYSAATAPVAALLSITSKVGFYVILRLSILIFKNDITDSYDGLSQVLFYGGIITLIFGFICVLASQNLPRMAANSVLISTGTVIAAIGLNSPALTDVAVYYVLTSTFALAALFLLVEPIERGQDAATNVLAITMEVYGDDEEEEEDEIGFYIPATLAILGSCFAFCALLLIGMPPFSGFIAKLMFITGTLWPDDASHAATMPDFDGWLFIIVLILSGFAQLIAMVRSGIRIFWTPLEANFPKVQFTEIIPIATLLGFCLILTLAAQPVMLYLNEMSDQIHNPSNYINSVLNSTVIGGK